VETGAESREMKRVEDGSKEQGDEASERAWREMKRWEENGMNEC